MFSKTVLAAAALACGATAAFASPVQSMQAGAFVYDEAGAAIGSVRSVQDGQAVIWVGFYNTPGNRLVTVPASRLNAMGGRVVLNGTSSSLASK